jgi:hypothetical protein
MLSITSGSGELPSTDIFPRIVTGNSGISPEPPRLAVSLYVPLRKEPIYDDSGSGRLAVMDR